MDCSPVKLGCLKTSEKVEKEGCLFEVDRLSFGAEQRRKAAGDIFSAALALSEPSFVGQILN